MKTLRELYPKYKWKTFSGVFGIEIETETPSSSSYPTGFFIPSKFDADSNQEYVIPIMGFHAVEDHSLRNFGMEFVFDEPMSYEDSLKTLLEFGKKTEGITFLKDAPATSVHVHVNMMNESILTMANFMTIWTAYENVLLEYSGKTRRSNLFALPVRVAEGCIDNVVDLFQRIEKDYPNPLYFDISACKYSAMNLCSLSTKGSLEIRCFRGTTDVSAISDWIGILNSILEYSRSNLTPVLILDLILNNPETSLDIFGEFYEKLKTPSTNDQVERNLVYLYQIVSSVSDWNSLEPKGKKTNSNKSVQAFAQAIGLTISPIPWVGLNPEEPNPYEFNEFPESEEED